jgi:hypothetical protein
MLDECAEGWTDETKKHRKWVYWNGATSTDLPLGPHDKRNKPNYEIACGKVRNLVWTLGIDHECASRALGIPISARP